MSRKLATSARVGLLAAISLLVAVPMAGTASAQVDDVVAAEQISDYDIEQRMKFKQVATHQTPSRQEVIDELRDEMRRLREARAHGIEVTDAEVDAAYATMAGRMRLTSVQLTQALAHAGVDAGTLKRRIRADITWRQYTRSPARRIEPDVPRIRPDVPPTGPRWCRGCVQVSHGPANAMQMGAVDRRP